MDVEKVRNAIRRFARRHRQAFSEIPKRQSAMLELGAIVGVAEHYRSNGFDVDFRNPKGRNEFVIKTSTRGKPWNYSSVVLKRGKIESELHMNLVVRSAHDNGRYCVDVAIVRPDSVPTKKPKSQWICLPNQDVQSFAEVKRLVIYPMLLAQFIGIVHEIKPRFLRKPKVRLFDALNCLPPTLISLGHYSANSSEIVTAYRERGIQVHVAEGFDMRIAAARAKKASSPLYWPDQLK